MQKAVRREGRGVRSGRRGQLCGGSARALRRGGTHPDRCGRGFALQSEPTTRRSPLYGGAVQDASAFWISTPPAMFGRTRFSTCLKTPIASRSPHSTRLRMRSIPFPPKSNSPSARRKRDFTSSPRWERATSSIRPALKRRISFRRPSVRSRA